MTIHRSFPSSALPCTVDGSMSYCSPNAVLVLFLFFTMFSSCSISCRNRGRKNTAISNSSKLSQEIWFKLFTLMGSIELLLTFRCFFAITDLTQYSFLAAHHCYRVRIAQPLLWTGKMRKSDEYKRLLCYGIVFLFTWSLLTPWWSLWYFLKLDRSGFSSTQSFFVFVFNRLFMHQLILRRQLSGCYGSQ